MDIRTRDTDPVVEHGGTVTSLFFFKMEELRNEVKGGYLEFVDEFEVAEGKSIEPHSHDSDEFYYVIDGEGTMVVDDENAPFHRGELVRIPPHAIHSLRADRGGPIRCLAFAISYMPEDRVGYTAYPTDGSEPHFVSTRYWEEDSGERT